jgi:hypothetical protein
MGRVKKKVEHLKDKKFLEMLKALKSIDNLYEMIAYIITFRMKELLVLVIVILLSLQLYPQVIDFVLGFFK